MTDIDKVYRKYFTDVYRYILSLCKNEALAEEITQESFFKALKGLDSFKGECSLYAWLCQIAKNTYLTHLKKQKRFTENEPEFELQSNTKTIEEEYDLKEKSYLLHKALHKMEEPYKEVFTLRTFGELSFSQIAELFGKTESWARVTYHRARLKLRLTRVEPVTPDK